nr:hypothetical protein [uncultured Roseateles sp.]
MQRDGQYRGVTYRVESTPASGDTFVGHFQLLDAGRRRHDAAGPEADRLAAAAPAAEDAFGDELAPGRNEANDVKDAKDLNDVEGVADVVHPSMDAAWATENEALNYATEAACHAIEILQLGRPQAQGRGSSSSRRRTDSLGQ